MKKLLTVLSIFALAFGMAISAKADEKISPTQVPNSLRVFVEQHFGKDVSIVAAERDRKGEGFEYDIKLSNGVKIEYGVSDEWLEVEGKNVPATIVGETIMNHIQVNYPGNKVTKIEREYPGYKVNLGNGKELIYDRSYTFIGEDRD